MSACIPTDRLLQTIQVHAPGVTTEMISLELFNAMDEFFKRTSAWRHKDDVKLEKGVIEYSYGVPSGAELVRMIGITHNGIPVPFAGQGGTSAVTGTGKLDPALVFPDGDAMFEPVVSARALYMPPWSAIPFITEPMPCFVASPSWI